MYTLHNCNTKCFASIEEVPLQILPGSIRQSLSLCWAQSVLNTEQFHGALFCQTPICFSYKMAVGQRRKILLTLMVWDVLNYMVKSFFLIVLLTLASSFSSSFCSEAHKSFILTSLSSSSELHIVIAGLSTIQTCSIPEMVSWFYIFCVLEIHGQYHFF